MCPAKVLKLRSDVSDVLPNVLKFSFEVSECKPLTAGTAGVRTTMDSATIMHALHIPGIVRYWGGGQPARTNTIANQLAAYNEKGSAWFSSFPPGAAELVTAQVTPIQAGGVIRYPKP
jgi:hypothetical protein